MKKQIGLWVCLLALPFLPGCGKKEEAAAVVEDGKFAGAFTCEEHWMVALTARDLQGMAALAGAPAADAEAKPTDKEREYQIGAVTLAMAPSCWDVESYRPLLEPWDATATAATSAAPDLLGDLLVPRASVIQKANEAVSARIKAAPADPRVHEEAAFLLGVFGVRENARAFGDLRPLTMTFPL